MCVDCHGFIIYEINVPEPVYETVKILNHRGRHFNPLY